MTEPGPNLISDPGFQNPEAWKLHRESGMVERVARALCIQELRRMATRGGEDGGHARWILERPAELAAHAEQVWPGYADDARAVIAAMRDIDNDILAAGYEAMFEDEWDGTEAPMMGAGWEAMIDEILEEQPHRHPEVAASA